ncbi:MAG: type II toxin-antitoxin system Phd/YefM family antitoxin [Candidatus Bipolaricaulota bacterium]|nr:type II toxin-antitoxin system Phd/YefM family antitoxin [Candidatus Bipolaricaulota bacterium]MCX8103878.1 type II toxin-antitoxin system Phd/YefM family antitoxin [Candidatus Bipolaricaulota bacterium]MDW8110517.1 type II toxin-antitoxin system Phd/YefM family antitoxin [Candidatus Bipolaricaulota bacterium]
MEFVASGRVVRSSEVSRHFGELLDKLDQGELIVLRHGRPEAVIVDFQRYEQLHQELKELRALVDHLHLCLEIEQRRGDRVLPAEAVAKELGLE